MDQERITREVAGRIESINSIPKNANIYDEVSGPSREKLQSRLRRKAETLRRRAIKLESLALALDNYGSDVENIAYEVMELSSEF